MRYEHELGQTWQSMDQPQVQHNNAQTRAWPQKAHCLVHTPSSWQIQGPPHNRCHQWSGMPQQCWWRPHTCGVTHTSHTLDCPFDKLTPGHGAKAESSGHSNRHAISSTATASVKYYQVPLQNALCWCQPRALIVTIHSTTHLRLPGGAGSKMRVCTSDGSAENTGSTWAEDRTGRHDVGRMPVCPGRSVLRQQEIKNAGTTAGVLLAWTHCTVCCLPHHLSCLMPPAAR